jgi:hypothetical protein
VVRKRQTHLDRKLGREWRIDRLGAVLRFAYSDSDAAQLLEEMRRLSGEIGAIEWETTFAGDPDYAYPLVLAVQKKLRQGLEILRDGQPGYDVWHLPKVGRYLTKWGDKYRSTSIGSADDAFLHKCADLLSGPDGWRLVPCSEDRCENFIVKRKKGAYCAEHGSSAARSGRFQKRLNALLSPADKRKRRRKLYELQMRRRGVPAAVIRTSHRRWLEKEKGNSDG